MNGAVPCEEYAKLIGSDYLDYYVRCGGSTVKVVLADDNARTRFKTDIAERAIALGYVCTSLSAANVRINKLEDVWFGVARQIDWLDMGRRFLKAVLFPRFDVPEDDFSVDGIARKNGLERWAVQKALDEVLHARLIRQKGLSGEFRRAVFNIVGSLLSPVGVVASATPFVLEWLRGELTSIVPVKSAMLYRKIGKTNGRQMLVSLPKWLRECRIPGLVLTVDIARITSFERMPDQLNYGRTGRIDCYEAIRQFIDTVDAVDGFALWFVADPEFAEDDQRGMHTYPALEMRLAQDVYDSTRSNPFASMVRLS